MSISSRTPDGFPCRCRVCGALFTAELSKGLSDTSCPGCGNLVVMDTTEPVDTHSLLQREPPGPPVELTQREQQVFELAVQGLSVKSVSDELGITVARTKRLVHNVRRKMLRSRWR